MISRIDGPVLRDRIYRVGFGGMLREIVRKARERGIPMIRVNPKGTSSSARGAGL
ncbi:artificial fragment of inactivated transposase [Thermoproteus tenax Kra 1]|uniref:Artificial of inactivated transposase n=2 Tax=Thermoproteus tenax TaxID=2271 RepID=G4RPH1_THETK|nr:artificial fragment of inactivated transposase [Thermoproteus tenax Kra 1]